MKNYITFFLGLILSTSMALAGGGPNQNPQAVISFSFVQSSGTNASAVTWNKKKKVYYTVIAGNSNFPLETFDRHGNPLHQGDAGADFRGLWFNKKGKMLQGNLNGSGGWVEMSTDKKAGTPEGKPQNFVNGMQQPDGQAVGTYDSKAKEVIFYSQQQLFRFNVSDGSEVGSMQLDIPVSAEDINQTTVGYTGKKNHEFVLLDIVRRKLYFFNRDGEFTAESQLPTHAPVNAYFRFSFANGIAFLYNAEARKWTGYEVF